MDDDRSGLLVLDKPSGITSHDCVHAVRKHLKIKRVGHCGTLDPIATGVLLLLVGAATARQEHYMGLEKTYWFRAVLGASTDTGDRDGKPLPCSPYRPIPSERMNAIAQSFLGEQWQVPPRYSALKFKGKHSYEYARRGIELLREARRIDVRRIFDVRVLGNRWEGRIACSRGTYVRTLIEDIAVYAGTGAYLEALVRESIGPYGLEQAISLEMLVASQTGVVPIVHAS
jgi:tRNA pseudouridine55 synthase